MLQQYTKEVSLTNISEICRAVRKEMLRIFETVPLLVISTRPVKTNTHVKWIRLQCSRRRKIGECLVGAIIMGKFTCMRLV